VRPTPTAPRPTPTPSDKPKPESSVETAMNKFIAAVSKSKNRPKKLATLRNCLQATNKTLSPQQIEQIVRRLMERKIVGVSGETVTYP
jgi:DNA-binding MurR/RpiR family transcriptional regulator